MTRSFQPIARHYQAPEVLAVRADGPYHTIKDLVEAARAHLKALGAPDPTDLPPYDESKYEPMPEVEIADRSARKDCVWSCSAIAFASL